MFCLTHILPGKCSSLISRVAVLGFGSSGQRFVKVVRESLTDVDLMVYSRHAAEAPGIQVTSHLEDVSAFQPQVAVVAGAASDRISMVRALSDQTVAFLIEKPLEVSSESGLELARIINERGAFCQVGYNLRFSPSLLKFRSLIAAGEVGGIVSVRAETGQYLPGWRPDRDYRRTVTARRDAGGGVLRELSHEIDYLQWIFGDISWVSARLGQQSQLEIDVEDVAHITCGFTPLDGPPEIVGQLNLDMARHDTVRSVTAIGRKGSLRWDGVLMKTSIWAEEHRNWTPVFSEDLNGPSTYALQWEGFCEALAGSASGGASVEEALTVLQVVEAAEKSHRGASKITSVVKLGPIG